jgi:hypothetical protein
LTYGQGQVPLRRDAPVGEAAETIVPEAEHGEASRDLAGLLGGELAPEGLSYRELEAGVVDGRSNDRIYEDRQEQLQAAPSR